MKPPAATLIPHLARARENGVTEQGLIEAITHPTFYAGWPSAVTAVGVAREVFGKKMTQQRSCDAL